MIDLLATHNPYEPEEFLPEPPRPLVASPQSDAIKNEPTRAGGFFAFNGAMVPLTTEQA